MAVAILLLLLFAYGVYLVVVGQSPEKYKERLKRRQAKASASLCRKHGCQCNQSGPINHPPVKVTHTIKLPRGGRHRGYYGRSGVRSVPRSKVGRHRK